jgi:hypothetical protein
LPDGKKGEKGGQKRGSKKCGFLVILVFYPFLPFFDLFSTFFDLFSTFSHSDRSGQTGQNGLLKLVDISNLNSPFCHNGKRVERVSDWSKSGHFGTPFLTLFDPFGPFHILTGLAKPVKMGLLKCVDISNLNTTF